MKIEEKVYTVVIAVAFLALILGFYMEFVSLNTGPINLDYSSSDLEKTIHFSPAEEEGKFPFVTRLIIFAVIVVGLAILIIWILRRVDFGKSSKKRVVVQKAKIKKKAVRKKVKKK